MRQKRRSEENIMSEKLSKWITQKEASEIMNKSLQSVYQFVKYKRLRSKKLFGKRLVSQQDVLNYKPKKIGRPRKV